MILSAASKPKRPELRGWTPKPANDEPVTRRARLLVKPERVSLEQMVKECGLRLIDGKVHSD